MTPEYYFLGYCLEQNTERGKFKFSPNDFLFLHPTNGASYLLVISANVLLQTNLEATSEGVKRYFEFNGRKSTQVAEIETPDFSDLKYFAKSISCLYSSDKTHGGGDGNLCEYRHKYGTTVHLWKNSDNSVYIIGGKNLCVTSRGIEH
jgi:hypothetical protein